MTKQTFSSINNYLDALGVNHLETTNSYEVARFVVSDEICVIYKGKKGLSGNNKTANKIVEAFLNRKLINIQECKRKSLKEKFYEQLIKRDGDKCFYTGIEMTKENASIEHLIPISRGGKNNLDNLVLCLKEENLKMANLSLVEKIKYKISFLKK